MSETIIPFGATVRGEIVSWPGRWVEGVLVGIDFSPWLERQSAIIDSLTPYGCSVVRPETVELVNQSTIWVLS